LSNNEAWYEVFSLEIKLFYKTQRELANALNRIIDAYWKNEISEETLIRSITDIYLSNQRKFLKEDDFTTVLKQQCGKRRLEVVERILEMNGLLKDGQTATG
jgi:uncharacterized protein (TIGR04540 family)